MATDTTKIRSRLTKLGKSLDELETQLEPLLRQSLPETLLALDTIQQAKLQVIIPYVVYDLVFVYLKSRGIDPKTHRVVSELERVRQYFDKIKYAEDSGEKRKLGVDKAAAERFIKHAIAQAKNPQLIDEPADGAAPVPSSSLNLERVPVKVTSKMSARAEYEKELKELDNEEEEDLEMFGEAVMKDEKVMCITDGVPGDTGPDGMNKGKGRASEEGLPMDEEVPSLRHKRPRIDPFSGYEIQPSPEPTPQETGYSKKAKPPTPAPLPSADDPSRGASVSTSDDRETAKKGKRKVRKAKKA